MTSSAAFRLVQAWLLEKPAAWVDDLPCGCSDGPAASLRHAAQGPRKDALLKAERSHQRHLLAARLGAPRQDLVPGSGSARTDTSAGGYDILERERARERVEELERSNRILRDPRASAQMS